jgi:uncharacterized protein YndB with AHSA1/START domain
MTSTAIIIEHRVPVPLERVWRAWADPICLCRWDPDRVDGEMAAGAELVMHWDSFGVALPVRVEGFELERRLHLRPHSPTGELHDWILELDGSGEQTRLRLELRGPMSEDERAGTAAGWHTQMRIVERFLLEDPQGERHSFAALGPTVSSVQRICEHFVLPEWLSAAPPRLEREGQRDQWTTHEGLTLHTELISLVDGRELALWCEELAGVARFRSLPLARGLARLVGVQVVRWGEASLAHPVQECFRMGVDRLIGELGGSVGTA